MKVRFELTAEDLIQFNLHHYQNSPLMKQSLRRTTIWSGALPLVMIMVMGLSGRFRWELLIPIALVAALVAALLARRQFPKAIEKQVRQNVEDNNNRALFGTHEIELENDWLVQRTEVSAHRQAWRAVDRIEETDEGVFFYLSAVTAHVIPKRKLPPAELQAFLERARQLWQASR